MIVLFRLQNNARNGEPISPAGFNSISVCIYKNFLGVHEGTRSNLKSWSRETEKQKKRKFGLFYCFNIDQHPRNARACAYHCSRSTCTLRFETKIICLSQVHFTVRFTNNEWENSIRRAWNVSVVKFWYFERGRNDQRKLIRNKISNISNVT